MRRGGGSGTGLAARHPEPVLIDLKLGDFATISRIFELISAILLPTVPVRDFRENVKPVKVSERLVKIIKHFDTTYYVFLRLYRFIWILLDFSHYR